MNNEQIFIGASRSESSCHKTVEVVIKELKEKSNFQGHRLLDVGCGEGVFTRILGEHYEEVHGIDVQENYIRSFRELVGAESRFFIHNMSASQMTFSDAYFDTVVTIESFEHILDIQRAASECARVLCLGGKLIITVPNRLFPFENHGVKIGEWEFHGRVPLLTWIPFLHDRIALARVFTVGDLNRLFSPCGFKLQKVGFLWPTFEHGGNCFQRFLKPMFSFMRMMEKSLLTMFGTSIVAVFERVEKGN